MKHHYYVKFYVSKYNGFKIKKQFSRKKNPLTHIGKFRITTKIPSHMTRDFLCIS